MGKKSFQKGNQGHTKERTSELEEEKEAKEIMDLNEVRIIGKRSMENHVHLL